MIPWDELASFVTEKAYMGRRDIGYRQAYSEVLSKMAWLEQQIKIDDAYMGFMQIPRHGSLVWAILQMDKIGTKAINNFDGTRIERKEGITYCYDITDFPGRIPILRLDGWTREKKLLTSSFGIDPL